MSRASTPMSAAGSAVPFGWAVVSGSSMTPTLNAGDRLLVRYRRTPQPGQVVVARFGDGTLVVKRAAERRATGWWLLSDNPLEGIDSRHRGTVGEAEITAVVLARVWPRPRRMRPRPAAL